MNTNIGLSFFRGLNESGLNGWSQVYARVPFDPVELVSKGALFGIVFGEKNDNWGDVEAEITNWEETFFNQNEVAGNLGKMFVDFDLNFESIDCVWVWITLVGNTREVRMVKKGSVGLWLDRGGRKVNLLSGMEDGKVIKGQIRDEDRLILSSANMSEWLSGWPFENMPKQISDKSEDLRQNDIAGGLLVIDAQKLEVESVEEVPNVESVVEVKKEPVVLVESPVIETSLQKEQAFLARDRFVGDIGIKERIFNKWKDIFKKRDGRVVVVNKDNKRQKMSIWLGGVFVVLLVVSLVSGSIKVRNENELKKWKSFYEPIEKSRLEALDLHKINPVGAKKLVEDIKSTFEVRKVEFLEGKYKNEVLDLGKKIDETWVIASGEKESSVEDLVRFDLIRQGFAADRFSFSKDGVFVVLDGTMGIVMSANVKNKEMKVLAGKGESLGWVDVLFDSNKSLVLYKSGVGVAGDKEVIKFDSAVSNALAMVKFGSNLYVLDQGNREIYKYIATDNGYGERSRWLKQNESLDITPVDFAIDSDIWVVDEKGKIERFRRGNKEQFSIIGMPEEVRVSRIAVEQTGNKIALLDTSVGRVIFCDKESGNCNSQLKSEKIKTATDIEYDSDGVLNLLFPGSIGVLR